MADKSSKPRLAHSVNGSSSELWQVKLSAVVVFKKGHKWLSSNYIQKQFAAQFQILAEHSISGML